jgi:hypothetical protein
MGFVTLAALFNEIKGMMHIFMQAASFWNVSMVSYLHKRTESQV